MITVKGPLTIVWYGEDREYLVNAGTEDEIDLCDLIESFEDKFISITIRDFGEEE